MTMNAISPEREERRRRQKELADQLKASGAMDEIFAKIDAGEPLTGEQGLLGGMLKAALERGLDAELTEHVGYDRGDAEAAMHHLWTNELLLSDMARRCMLRAYQ
jgi:putative transposase